MYNRQYFEGYIETNKVQRGEFNLTTIYYRGDTVTTPEGYFISLTDNNIGNSLEATDHWQKYIPEELSLINDQHLESTTSTLSSSKIQALINQKISDYLSPSEVTGVQVSNISQTSFDLNWSDSANVNSYIVEINGTQTEVTVSQYSFSNLQPNTSYTVLVKAKNQFFTTVGSNITATTLQVQIPMPSPITNLFASNVTETNVVLSWTSSNNATEYEIYSNNSLITTTTETSFTFTNLTPDTTYNFSVASKNVTGTSYATTITTKTVKAETPITDGLIFNVDFSNKKSTNSNIVYDTVGNLACTLHNVSHDGATDGYLDNIGLTLAASDYVAIPTNTATFLEKVDMNQKGLTFEFVAYEVNGVIFRNESGNFKNYIGGTSSNTFSRYIATDNTTEKTYSTGQYWYVNPEGNRTIPDTLNGTNELNMITVRFYPNGEFDMLVNGRPSLGKNKPTDFLRYANVLANGSLFIRRNHLGANTTPTLVKSFSIFNKVVSNADALTRYNNLKQLEPLKEVKVVPSSVLLKSGENQLLAVSATPARFTSMLSNTFASGNQGYVTVDSNGLLTGINNGQTEVLVTSTINGQSFQNYVPVTVGNIADTAPTSARTVNGISLNKTTETLEVGQSYPAMATTLPFDVFNDNIVIWESSNPSVCTVNFGVLKGISEGASTITVYDGTKTFSKSFTVNVVSPSITTIQPSEIFHVDAIYFGISTNNSDAKNTTNGIQNALNHASSNGFRKVVFPKGAYLITPEARTIYPPTNLIIDFSDSTLNIAQNNLSPKGYTMFKLENVSYTKILNMHLYGERDSVVNVSDAHETCISVYFDNAYKSGLENCTISKSPGFNIVGHNTRGADQPGRHPSKDNWEAGQLNDSTGATDDSVLTYCFRNKTFLNVSGLSDNYLLGYTQGYFAYTHLRSRLYSIYWYDQNYNFIVAHKHRLQYYRYSKPVGAHYAKIVIYQESLPISQDSDFNAVAMLRSYKMPTGCFIRNCTIEDNNSCGIAITGGTEWIIEDNTFARNGKRMPSCDIDWEDGWELSVGDVCRGNTFNSPSGVIISGGNSIALYDNVFNFSNLHVWERVANFRIYNNYFNGKGGNRNLALNTSADSHFARNILKNVTYTKGVQHLGASYQVRDTSNTLI
ncbi:fibronectin type III domain-containing protein [Paenibacillus sp. GCM10027627]|uniref:fibronectin type III domain-containing protein n=1 Tax=unclassified Paenibacillus TaxID=185978 RepID=UPI0036309342